MTSTDDDNKGNLIFKRDSDSVKTDSANIPEKPIIGDPPPKNGHQWWEKLNVSFEINKINNYN